MMHDNCKSFRPENQEVSELHKPGFMGLENGKVTWVFGFEENWVSNPNSY